MTFGSRSVLASLSQTADMPTHASGDTTVRGLGSGLWNSHPKNYGKGGRSCRVTKNQHALIRKYGINMCRQAFRERAGEIGFVKYHRPPQLGTLPFSQLKHVRSSSIVKVNACVDYHPGRLKF